MKRLRLFLLLGGVLLLVACAPGRRYQPGWQGEGRAWFDAEWIQGFAGDGSPVATVSVSVPRRHLIFFAGDSGYESRYRIRCVQRSNGRALRSQEWGAFVSVDRYEETRNESQEQRTVQFAIDPAATGDLQLIVSLAVEGSRRQATRVLVADRLRKGAGGLGMGDVRLYVEREPGRPGAEAISLAQGEFPDAQRFAAASGAAFDRATGVPWLFVRVFDLRGEAEGVGFPLTVEIRPGRKNARFEVQMPRLGVESGLLLPLDAALFAFGMNEVQLSLAPDVSDAVKLENLGMDLEEDESWAATLRQIEELATEQAWSRLRETPAGARGAAWEAFWARMDATPGDGVNQRLREHDRRVQFARRSFRDGVADGALSDRGRIYVLHGEPSRVEDIPPRWDDPTAWQIWHYDALALVYYFRQVEGGSFRMVGSERA